MASQPLSERCALSDKTPALLFNEVDGAKGGSPSRIHISVVVTCTVCRWERRQPNNCHRYKNNNNNKDGQKALYLKHKLMKRKRAEK